MEIDTEVPPSSTGCQECLQAQGWWVHLRRCAACGHVGCCDSSPGKHATGHYRATGHRLMTSFEPGEDWFYDFATGEPADGFELQGPTSHPPEQPVPGPAGMVPRNWRELID